MKSLTLKSARPSGNSRNYNLLKDFYQMFAEKKYTIAQSFLGIYIHFGVNMLSAEMSHIQDVISEGRNQATKWLKSGLIPKYCDVHFGCKKQAQRSTSQPPSTLPLNEQFSPWPLITGTFVFHPALVENKGRRLKAVPYFTPTSTEQFRTMLIPLLGWSKGKSAEIANVQNPRTFLMSGSGLCPLKSQD